MIILGLTNSNGAVAAALVRDGKYLIGSRMIGISEFHEGIASFLTDSEVELSQLNYIAYDENFDLDTEFIDAPSLVIKKNLARYYSVFVMEDEIKEDEEIKIEFPLLFLSDTEAETKVELVSGLDNIKPVAKLKPGSLVEIIKQFEQKLDIKNVDIHADQGDDSENKFQRIVAEAEMPFDFSFLLKELDTKISSFGNKRDKDLSEELNQQLYEYFSQDTCVALLNAVYESIIIYMVSTASELGINNIAVVGGIADKVKLRQKFTEQAEMSSMEIFFPIKEEELIDAIGIAALAAYGLTKK